MAQRFWLFKSEPSVFSFDDLEKSPSRTTSWEGVRNYQARNRLRDEVKRGDGVLFYHSSCAVPAVVGLCTVVREAYPDPHQFDRKSRYYDQTADPAEPRWLLVDVRAERALPKPVTLDQIKSTSALAKMDLLRRGNRLSIQPVSAAEWKAIRKLGGL
ncbi:MAG TPA: EVE domain-containing protein [Myxococcota bacterium]|nr:EVE domain-containing protein [Myxococcota bacterium]